MPVPSFIAGRISPAALAGGVITALSGGDCRQVQLSAMPSNSATRCSAASSMARPRPAVS